MLASFFYDANLADDKQYLHELLERLVGSNKRWMAESTMDIVNKDLTLDLMERSGCQGLILGLESFSQPTLRQMGKGFNRVDVYETAVKKLHDRGITVQGSLMFGFDQDDASVFERAAEFAKTINLDGVATAVLTPLPGTRLYDEYEAAGRIFSRDWAQYDTKQVVSWPARMSPEELDEGRKSFAKEFYSPRNMASRIVRSGRNAVKSVAFNIYKREVSRRAGDLPSALHR